MMKRPTDPMYDVVETYDIRLANWTRKELQLSRLHEEILTQREALLNYSLSYTNSQDSRTFHETVERERAHIRNEQFLQRIADTEEMLEKEAAVPPSPRLTTMQNNYWSMVRSMIPLYEKSIGHKERKSTRESSPSHKNQSSNSAPATQKTKSSLKEKSKKEGKKKKKFARF